MPTNWGDALLQALRTQLVTVAGLPAARQWLNTSGTPSPTAAFIEDGFVTLDSEYSECGPTAWSRTQATYRVSIRVPIGTDAHVASSIAAAIVSSFRTATITVLGYPIELQSTRVGPSLTEPQWLHLPVYLAITFDHP